MAPSAVLAARPDTSDGRLAAGRASSWRSAAGAAPGPSTLLAMPRFEGCGAERAASVASADVLRVGDLGSGPVHRESAGLDREVG